MGPDRRYSCSVGANFQTPSTWIVYLDPLQVQYEEYIAHDAACCFPRGQVFGKSAMVDAKAAHVDAHRNNIQRYRALLETYLTDVEREYIE